MGFGIDEAKAQATDNPSIRYAEPNNGPEKSPTCKPTPWARRQMLLHELLEQAATKPCDCACLVLRHF